ncbi:MAG: LPS export ABC transporter periplasmic protein LptC [Planctomycetota bacterium]|nr:LPS export ABC transporter periplasmic protein LptC [Planctomycetota bacterium]
MTASKLSVSLKASSSRKALTLLSYAILAAVLAGIAFAVVFNPPAETEQQQESRELTPAKLEDFTIPHYSEDGELVMLISGASAVLAGEGDMTVLEPSVRYYSGDGEEHEEILFKAQKGVLRRSFGEAELTGKVLVEGLVRSGNVYRRLWRLTGDELKLSQKRGEFLLGGKVAFVSEGLEISGINLRGKLDVETAVLESVSFERNTVSEIYP